MKTYWFHLAFADASIAKNWQYDRMNQPKLDEDEVGGDASGIWLVLARLDKLLGRDRLIEELRKICMFTNELLVATNYKLVSLSQ